MSGPIHRKCQKAVKPAKDGQLKTLNHLDVYTNRFFMGTSPAVSPEDASRGLEEWASIAPKGIIVFVTVYADESGTHDITGNQTGAGEAVVSGIALQTRDWAAFCRQWQSVLNRYKAPYFHFEEWVRASAVARGKRKQSTSKPNVYQHLDSKCLDEFLLELAKLAGQKEILHFAGFVHTKRYVQAQACGNITNKADPYSVCLRRFFNEYVAAMKTMRPSWEKKRVLFVFDQTGDNGWVSKINQEFQSAAKLFPQFVLMSFGDKKDPCFSPLQAADMVAYRARQFLERKEGGSMNEYKMGYWPGLDLELLLKPAPARFFAEIDKIKALMSKQLK